MPTASRRSGPTSSVRPSTGMTTRRYVDSNHIFHVYLTSAVVKNELSFNRTALVEALNKAVGSTVITDIKFH